MFFLENVRLAFGALVNNKMRSLLTMLGIIIGISSVIMITTIGNSLQKTLANTFGMLSEVGYQVDYGFKDFETEDASDWDFRDSDYITKEMLDTLYEEMDGKYLVSQQKWLGDATIRNSKNQMLKLSVSGASGGTMTSMVNIYKLIKGRYLTEEDTRRIKNAAMVSDVFIQQYFLDGEDPIGKTISVNVTGICNADLVIVGIYKTPKILEKRVDPGASLMDKETEVFIPYQTAMRLGGFEPSKESTYYPTIVPTDPNADPEVCRKELQNFFDEQYESNRRIEVQIRSNEQMVEQVNQVLNIVTVAISVIAAISLLVGGIGVMNIMLVSITERTREIGVRKAIGAKNQTIRTQFIIESVILCLTGGLIGVMLGIGGGMLIGYAAKNLLMTNFMYADMIEVSVEPSLKAILVSLGFSMLIGVFFGSYPASKAAKLNPIDALRYE